MRLTGINLKIGMLDLTQPLPRLYPGSLTLRRYCENIVIKARTLLGRKYTKAPSHIESEVERNLIVKSDVMSEDEAWILSISLSYASV